MDEFAKLPSHERRLYFEQTAAQLGLSAQIIEKDFWVCWSLSRYFAPSVKIELGARSDHFPVEQATVTPYLSDAISDALTDSSSRVRVLGAERTFWEKATILHMLHHLPTGKTFAPRMSRHYYDVYQLSRSPILEHALDNLDLLDRVATHKSVFFKSAWANYESARPGTLRLVPRAPTTAELTQDYTAMHPMFFHDAPDFDAILTAVQELEDQINGLTH